MDSNIRLLELQNISKSFSGKKILDNITFSVDKGDFFGIIGPNGAGKSTLIDILVTLSNNTEGKICFNGGDYKKSRKDIRSNIGYVPQNFCFYPDLTVTENMVYFAKMYNSPKAKTKHMIDELLSIVELKKSKDIVSKKLSGGMQRRLNIACSLVHDPDLVVLDEPAANLDHHQREEMWHLLKFINREGKTIVITSHMLHDMNRVCNKVAFMFKGSLLFTGTPKELQSNFKNNMIVDIATNPGNYLLILSALRPILAINSHEIKNNSLRMNITNINYAIHQMVHILDGLGESIVDMDIDKPSLDDTFEEIIKRFTK